MSAIGQERIPRHADYSALDAGACGLESSDDGSPNTARHALPRDELGTDGCCYQQRSAARARIFPCEPHATEHVGDGHRATGRRI